MRPNVEVGPGDASVIEIVVRRVLIIDTEVSVGQSGVQVLVVGHVEGDVREAGRVGLRVHAASGALRVLARAAATGRTGMRFVQIHIGGHVECGRVAMMRH